jgi:NADPH2:quinone reductase
VGGELGTEAAGLVADGGRISAHGAASGDFAELDEERLRERGITVRGIAEVLLAARVVVRLSAKAPCSPPAESSSVVPLSSSPVRPAR